MIQIGDLIRLKTSISFEDLWSSDYRYIGSFRSSTIGYVLNSSSMRTQILHTKGVSWIKTSSIESVF